MTRCRVWLTVLAVLGLLVVGAQAAQASTLGETTVGGSDGGGLIANAKRVTAYQLTVPASVSKLDIYLSPSGTPGSQVMEGVIYADAGGSPGALVAQSQEISFSSTSAAGWTDLPFASAVALSPGRYWLGIYTGATGAVASYRFDAGASARARRANNQTYLQGGASDPFGTIGWGDSHVMSLYATYTTPAWALQSLPAPAGSSGQLAGVSCASTTACTAVGDQSRSGTTVTLAERWNGTRWSLRATPNPAGATAATLNGVSCASATACLAVGSYQNSSGTTVTLAERWDGTRWSLQTIPATGNYSALTAVSCTSSTTCIAVGGSSDGSGGHNLLAERWNGTSWSIQATPNPPGTNDSSFNAVSCTSSTACTAVGGLSTSFAESTFAERYDGTSWSLQTTPAPGDFSVLNGVSCTSSTACTAVGSSSLEGGPQVTLAEQWDGTSWSIQATPNPSPRESLLSGVSCPSSTNCAAVGNSTGASVPELPLAERYW